jgi:hypothetical protein
MLSMIKAGESFSQAREARLNPKRNVERSRSDALMVRKGT